MSSPKQEEPIRVAVVQGGPSSEAAVSRASGAAVARALRATGHDVRIVELSADFGVSVRGSDVAFPVSHGPLGEDGCLQGALEVFGIPYVGSDVRASAIAAHKPSAKLCFRARGLPVAEEYLVTVGDDLERAVTICRAKLGSQVIVKPASGGSAIGVTRVVSEQDEASWMETVATAIESALRVDCGALVESFVAGHEVTCGVLEGPGGPRVLPPTLIHSTAADWYDFRSRYQRGGSRHECPAPLPAPMFARVQELALASHHAVGARDLSRVDFVVTESKAIVLEVNTLPGMTATSNYPEAAAVVGVDFPSLCSLLVQSALTRPKTESPAEVPIPHGGDSC